MYDPKIGRFLTRDPMGLPAGDLNLYNYESNDPAARLDPSGESSFITPNSPPIGRVPYPTTYPSNTLTHYGPVLPRDEPLNKRGLALQDLKFNRDYYKQLIVNQTYNMLAKNPAQVGNCKCNKSELAKQSNDLADIYIDTVVRFLNVHFGAAPGIGQRSNLGDLGVWLDIYDSPWCADWAEAVNTALWDAKVSGKINCIAINYGQWNGKVKGSPRQHNFVIIKPAGYQIQFLPTIDPVITILDPWRNLLPGAYPASNTRPTYAPTNIGPQGIGYDPANNIPGEIN